MILLESVGARSYPAICTCCLWSPKDGAICLDSQDYSTLTDPKTLTAERVQLREALSEFPQAGTVAFVFSGAEVNEAVAISSDATRLAELKAEVLGDLFVISSDRLMYAEVTALRLVMLISMDINFRKCLLLSLQKTIGKNFCTSPSRDLAVRGCRGSNGARRNSGASWGTSHCTCKSCRRRAKKR